MNRDLTSGIIASLALCGALVLPATTRAQAASDPPKKLELDNFRTPSSPAFTLLGVSPTAIARPSTPRALATELLSTAKNGSGIPNNYAIEFAPYWLVPHPSLTFHQYTNPTSAQSVAQSFSVSLATSRPDTATDTASTFVALGARFLPLGGHTSKKFDGLKTQLDSIQQRTLDPLMNNSQAFDAAQKESANLKVAQTEFATATTDEAKKAASQKIADIKLRLANAKELLVSTDSIVRSHSDTMRALALAMGKADAERVGGFVELAAAASAAYPGRNFDAGKFNRLGVWGTFTYRTESRVDATAVVRLLRDVNVVDQNAIDLGGKLLWQYNDLGLSGEYVSRTAFTVDSPTQAGSATQRTVTFASSSRAVGVVDYRAAESMYITMSFGQDYKLFGEARHPLVATLGLQLLYGDKPVVKLK